MDNRVIIRRAVQSDIEVMADLLGELFSLEKDFNAEPHRQKKGLRLLIEDDTGFIIVAETDSRVVGMCSVQGLISTAEGGYVGLVEDVVVSRDFRGKGIGKRLIDDVVVYSKEKGMTRLQLLADKNNHPAIGFYLKLGWQTTELVAMRTLL